MLKILPPGPNPGRCLMNQTGSQTSGIDKFSARFCGKESSINFENKVPERIEFQKKVCNAWSLQEPDFPGCLLLSVK